MTRAEFLKKIWNKRILPFVYLLSSYWVGKSLVLLYKHKATMLPLVLFFLIVFVGLITWIEFAGLVRILTNQIWNKLSSNMQRKLLQIFQWIQYLTLLPLAYWMFNFYQNNSTKEVLFLLLLLLLQFYIGRQARVAQK